MLCYVMLSTDVRCVDDNDDIQPDEKCDDVATDVEFDVTSTVRPSVAQPCSVPCNRPSSPMQCIFSYWTSWSPCSRRCDGVSRRFRFMQGRSFYH